MCNRNQYTGPGGGAYTGPSGYKSNIPPWKVYVVELEKRGLIAEAELIRKVLSI